MILSITDGIEVHEHTEPQERAEFCAEFKLAQALVAVKYQPAGYVPVGLLARQAE